VSEFTKIIEAMRVAVPAQRPALDDAEASVLRQLTERLAGERPEAAAEYERFLSVANREICLPEGEVRRRVEGATILLTGGTGCIGSTLVGQLAARNPARIVSVSRGVTDRWPRWPSVEYRHADVTDAAALAGLTRQVRPDIVFHVAAQRSPALAETEVHHTVSVNTLGTRNVLAAAAGAGVAQVVCASTGKALRPYSPDIYTAAKRAAEWVCATMAAGTSSEDGDSSISISASGTSGMLVSAGRFTHVIDNSIVHDRLRRWAKDTGPGAALRLHGPEIAFYVQSAVESAQLLLVAMTGAVPGEFRVHAISDLGWPVALLDVALGVLDREGSRTPVYISGYDPGYEEIAFPGLYDPATAGDVSPLINAFESARLRPSPCPRVDAFRLDLAALPAAPKLLADLDGVCAQTQDSRAVRSALDELSWTLLDATLAAASPAALARCSCLVRRYEDGLSLVHRRVMKAISAHADQP
jgi:NAD(P)-dependent dehydrogenase (short-subunit alcohol dehydrogenase family)